MNFRYLLFCSIFLAAFFSASAQADSHVLTVRQLPNDEYEAVVTYSSGDFCLIPVNPASSVIVTGNEVFIESPGAGQVVCFEKRPPDVPIEGTALIGNLPPGKYNIYWEQATDFSLVTPLVALDPDSSNPIPSSSTWALIMLLFGILAIVRSSFNTQHVKTEQ